jgi:hypothetical protein
MKTHVLPIAASVALLLIGSGAWAQQADGGSPGNPNTNKPPMQAQELASLVPQDSSEPKPTDISRQNTGSSYRYDKRGVNCSLYPARCRGGNN